MDQIDKFYLEVANLQKNYPDAMLALLNDELTDNMSIEEFNRFSTLF
jgi:hypothetical protein